MAKSDLKKIIYFFNEYRKCLDLKEAELNSKFVLSDFQKGIKGFYVYLLVNPITNKIFYVGKGSKNRATQHFKDYKKAKEKNIFKRKEFESFVKFGYKPIIKIVASNLEEQQALKIEKKIIKRLYCSLSNISLNENEPNVLKKEIKKIYLNLPSFEEWLSVIYIEKPLLFDVLKERNYGYEIYNLAKNCILKLAKEYEICQTKKI